MKKTFLFLITCYFAFAFQINVHAQSLFEDVVYLKNGSIIHGIIIEQIPNESVKIQTKDKNIFVYKLDEILKITKEDAAPGSTQSRSRRLSNKDNLKNSGYTVIPELTFTRSFSTTETAYTYGSTTYYEQTHFDDINNGPSIGIQVINGYQFSKYISAGIGIGVNIYSGLVLVPVFAGIRANFLPNRVTPFVAIDAGYSYSRKQVAGGTLASEDKGGIMLAPAVGIKFFVIPKMALNLSLGFRYQEMQTYDEYSYSYYTSNSFEDHSLRHFNLKFGFTF